MHALKPEMIQRLPKRSLYWRCQRFLRGRDRFNHLYAPLPTFDKLVIIVSNCASDFTFEPAFAFAVVDPRRMLLVAETVRICSARLSHRVSGITWVCRLLFSLFPLSVISRDRTIPLCRDLSGVLEARSRAGCWSFAEPSENRFDCLSTGSSKMVKVDSVSLGGDMTLHLSVGNASASDGKSFELPLA
jgi:hypothetical protein